MKWIKKDYIGLTIIPLEFLIGSILIKIPFIANNPDVNVIFNACLFFIGFLIMIFLFKDLLKSQWKLYKKKLWLKLIINVLLTIGAFWILKLTRGLMSGSLSINETDTFSYQAISIMLIGSIQPFIAPFAEELTFRYLLFQKFPNGLLKVLMFFVSSILFGLIHINNFSGDWMRTIPYMVIGGYFALICFSFKNIWGSIMTHWMFNSVNSVVPVLTILISKLFGLI